MINGCINLPYTTHSTWSTVYTYTLTGTVTDSWVNVSTMA